MPYLRQTIALIWEAAHWWCLSWIALLLAQGLLPAVTAYLARSGVNSLVAGVQVPGRPENIRLVFLYGTLIAAALILGETLRAADSYVRMVLSELMQDHISTMIQRKAASVDLSFYDSPDFYNRLHRAKDEALSRAASLVENLGSLLQGGIALLAMGGVLLPFGVWLPALLLAGTLPAVGVVVRYGFREHQWRQNVTNDLRRSWYYEWLMTSPEFAPEIRLFDLAAHFETAYHALRRKLRKEHLNLAHSRAWAELGAGGAALAMIGGATVAMVRRALQGRTTLGDLVLFYQACQQGMQLVRSLLQSIRQFHGNLLFLGDLFEFLSLESRLVRASAPKPAPEKLDLGIRFQDVTFRYPGSSRAVLNRFNLFLPANRITALIGANGAGKSTLVKLLTRLYDPGSGRVEIDGVDLREFDVADLRSRITVVFQQPAHYDATVKENIAFGDLPSMTDLEAIELAARDAGMDAIIAKLPRGLNTMLGRAFADDGIELSMGQWQRLALARAFLRRAPILVLDEPTSMMDPWDEAEWLAHFQSLAAGRTVVMITHRFTTAMIADLICVVDDGEIIESGSHQELLARKGRYALAWNGVAKYGLLPENSTIHNWNSSGV